jgi:hypothetical protein
MSAESSESASGIARSAEDIAVGSRVAASVTLIMRGKRMILRVARETKKQWVCVSRTGAEYRFWKHNLACVGLNGRICTGEDVDLTIRVHRRESAADDLRSNISRLREILYQRGSDDLSGLSERVKEAIAEFESAAEG